MRKKDIVSVSEVKLTSLSETTFRKPLAIENIQANISDDRRMSVNRDCQRFLRGLFKYFIIKFIIVLAILKAAEIYKTLDYLDNRKISFQALKQIQNNSNKAKRQKIHSVVEKKHSDHSILLQVSNSSCPTATPNDEIFSVPPNGRILIAVFPYGPNNQIRGFRETIFLAKMFNR